MNEHEFIITGPPDIYIPGDLSFSKFLLDGLKRGGRRIAIVNGVTGKTITYNEIAEKSISLAFHLRQTGLIKSDVVAICSENRFEFTITAFAVIFLGGVVAPINVTYTPGEIEHAFRLSAPKVVFCSTANANKIKLVAEKVSYVRQIILYGSEFVLGTTLYRDLINDLTNTVSFKPAEVDSFNDHLVILCSSGTTGMPKGVMLTHRNFAVCASHVKENFKESGFTESTYIFSMAPWSHAYGFVTQCILVGIQRRLVFAHRFEEKLYLSIIQDQRISIAFAVPPLVLFLAKNPLVSQYDLSSLEEIWCGAAPLSKEIQEAVVKRLKLRFIGQGYGMTETTLGVLRTDRNNSKPGSIGSVVYGTQVKVVNLKTGKALGPYEEGELCFKGPLMMKGYIGDIASTENIIDAEGWLRSGDIGYYDKEKCFFIIDRIKELIKYKGYQVPPAELEGILLQNECVVDAAVVGLPDEEAGELPLAFVVRKPNSVISQGEIVQFVAKNVSSAKRLRGGVIFTDKIPRNPAGKILRRELRNILKNSKHNVKSHL